MRALARAARSHKTLSVLVTAALLTAAGGAIGASAATTGTTTETRSKYTWPFSRDSIWNMPIGSGARYVPAGLAPANAWKGEVTTDQELIGVDPAAPIRTLNAPGQAGNGDQVRVPSDMQHDGSWNGCATLLRADNATVWSGQPITVSPGGNPSWTWTTQSAPVDLKGQGLEGCHGGSHLSGLGGSIRVGELNSSTAIRHALKINVYGKRFLYKASTYAQSYRWPAFNSDSYWSQYGGTNPAMRMGALLALPPTTDLSGITNPKALKLAIAMRDYGTYVVDDTAWDVHALNMDKKVATSGEWPTGDTSFHAQLQSVISQLAVVDNNSPTTVGGGGTPRAPLAPCFSDDTTCTSSAPAPNPTASPAPTSPTASPAPTSPTASPAPTSSAPAPTSPHTSTRLSSLTPTAATNGWGPYEKDLSNGEQATGDGRVLTLNGATHAHGLGVHAGSSLTYQLPAGTTQLRATVGVDDEVGSGGSVQFEVYADNTLRLRTAALTGNDAGLPITVDVSGASTLRLVVTDAGNGNQFDHGDWASAELLSTTATQTVTRVSSLPATNVTNGWGPAEIDRSNGEQRAGDGRTITLNGKTYSYGLGVHAASSQTFQLPARSTQFRATVGVDDEVGNNGSVVFEVYVDGALRYRSPLLTGASASQAVSVDVTGGSSLRLVVTDGGDRNKMDHADWAAAEIVSSS